MSENYERAALRGNPSFVWRAGQDRRLGMILQWTKLPKGPTLADILYTDAMSGKADEVEGAASDLTIDEESKLAYILVAGCGVGMYVTALEPFAQQVVGMDIEPEHLNQAVENVSEQTKLQQAAGEHMPYPDELFDLVLSHEVLEHVQDDQAVVAEMVRALRKGGRAIVFVPNRWHPFETHGHYWRGKYYFGNTPLINYLPDVWRNKLAPHVRAYTSRKLLKLFLGQPVRVIHHTQIFPGYDNIIRHYPKTGTWLRNVTYALEKSPLKILGNSHLLVVEKVEE
ncbi:MAG: class I SAM-dependent methyltransferase [Chloroflexota bacterium]